MAWKGFKDVQATIHIDLSKTEEELWNSADKDARWGAKKAEKEGLVVKEVQDNEEISKFYDIYKETCGYGGINAEPLDDILKNSPKFFLCYKDEILIAGAAIIIESGEKFRLYKNASLHEYLKFEPNNMLYWHLIKWGKANYYSIFDLGGYQLNAKEGDKLYNVNKFKARWGGEITTYPVYSYNPFYILGRKAIRNFKFFRWLNDKLKGRSGLSNKDNSKGNASSYESEKSVEHYDTDYMREIEKKLIDKYFKGKILDLGCGAGRTTNYLFEKDFNVLGVDISEKLIKRAKKRYPALKFEVGDACKLKFPDKHFDVVFFSFNGVDYITPENNRIIALKEIARVLKPSGIFAFSSHNSKALLFKFRPKFFIRNFLRGTLFSRYKWDKEEFGELYTYYAPPKKQIELIEANTSLKFVEKMDTGLRDLYPHYVFIKS